MFGKHFKSMYDGSMYGAGADVFAVWGYVIAHTVKSAVELNTRKLASSIGMPPERVQVAIDYLCQPDPHSRNTEHEGRRLVKEGAFQYRVPSHDLYNGIRNEEERREYNRLKQQAYRDRMKARSSEETLPNVTPLPSVTEPLPSVPPCTHIEEEVNNEAKKQKCGALLMEYPEWLPLEAWNGFVEMRKKIKAPLTDRAARIILGELDNLRSDGENVEAVLDRSTSQAWKGVFPVKGEAKTGSKTSEQQRTRYADPAALYESPAYDRRRA